MGELAIKAALERVRAATGPDRELDVEILAAISPPNMFAKSPEGVWSVNRRGTALGPVWEFLAGTEVAWLTTSVDAILALIKAEFPGAYGSVNYGLERCRASLLINKSISKDGYTTGWTDSCDEDGVTAAIALCAVLLSTIASGEQRHG